MGGGLFIKQVKRKVVSGCYLRSACVELLMAQNGKGPFDPTDDADSDSKNGNNLQLAGLNQPLQSPNLATPTFCPILVSLKRKNPIKSLPLFSGTRDFWQVRGLSGVTQTLILALGSFPSGS